MTQHAETVGSSFHCNKEIKVIPFKGDYTYLSGGPTRQTLLSKLSTSKKLLAMCMLRFTNVVDDLRALQMFVRSGFQDVGSICKQEAAVARMPSVGGKAKL